MFLCSASCLYDLNTLNIFFIHRNIFYPIEYFFVQIHVILFHELNISM